jgi:hypothetical protein
MGVSKELRAIVESVDDFLKEADADLLAASQLRCKIAVENMAAAPSPNTRAAALATLWLEEEHQRLHPGWACAQVDSEACREQQEWRDRRSEWTIALENTSGQFINDEREALPPGAEMDEWEGAGQKVCDFEMTRFYETWNNLEVLLELPWEDWPKKLLESPGVAQLRMSWNRLRRRFETREEFYEWLDGDLDAVEHWGIMTWSNWVLPEVDG